MADRTYNNIDVVPGGGSGGGSFSTTTSVVGANVSVGSNAYGNVGPTVDVTVEAGETVIINWTGFVRQNAGTEGITGVDIGVSIDGADTTMTFLKAELSDDRAVGFSYSHTFAGAGTFTIALRARLNTAVIAGFAVRDALGTGLGPATLQVVQLS